MKLIYPLALLLCVGIQSHAQEKRDTIRPNTSNTRQTQKKRNELGLSKKQAQELKSSNQDFKQKMQDIRSDSTLSQAQQREQRRKLMMERKQKMDSLLTPEQREKAKEMRKAKRGG